MILNDGNENDLYVKISLKVSYYSNGNEIWSKKKILYKFQLPPNITSPIGNTLERIL